jgi:hypothetical protein
MKQSSLLFLALPAALALYAVMRMGLGVEPDTILNGGLIGASVIGAACSLEWAFRRQE